MRSIFIVVISLVFVVTVFTAGGAETPDYIPDSSIAVVTISNVQTDPGIFWLLDAWINSPRESPLRDFFKTTTAREMSVAVFPQKGDHPLYLLLVVDLAGKTKTDKDILSKVIKQDTDIKLRNMSYKGAAINFVSAEETGEDFTAYTVLKNQVLIGTDVEVLKKAIDGPSISKSPGYHELEVQFSRGGDGLLFADNSGAQFVNFLKPLEEKWKMSLLLSAEYLEWMGCSFDVIDPTKVTGRFVFQGINTDYIEDIQDDAEFLGEAFKRKFIAEKIEYSSDVKVKDRTVSLNFQIKGLESLWKKLFEQGVLSLIRPE